jgi:hypothetical protein
MKRWTLFLSLCATALSVSLAAQTPDAEASAEPEVSTEVVEAVEAVEAAADEPAATDAVGETPIDLSQWRYQNTTLARYNPLGLFNQLQVGYRRYLWQPTGSRLRDGSYLALNLAPTVSPAWARIGPQLEIQPLAILRLVAQYDWVGHFGTFDTIQSFQTANADWREATMEANSETASYATTGHVVTLSGTLQAAVGPIALRSELRGIYHSLDLQGEDTLFYDIVFDLLAPNRAWLTTTDSDILYLDPSGDLKIGIRHTWIRANYDETNFLDTESQQEGNEATHRIGPLVTYRLNPRQDVRFSEPTLILIMNWWLQHPYRTGVETSQAVPYVVLGFRFNGRLDVPR